jgi:hypothetical protein
MGKMDNTKSRQGGGEWGINFYSHLAGAYTGFPPPSLHTYYMRYWPSGGSKKLKIQKEFQKQKF